MTILRSHNMIAVETHSAAGHIEEASSALEKALEQLNKTRLPVNHAKLYMELYNHHKAAEALAKAVAHTRNKIAQAALSNP